MSKSTRDEFAEFDEAAREFGREVLRVIEPALLPVLRWLQRLIERGDTK